MNSMPDRIVHIGFPKTATTFLQKGVFPFLENTRYVDFRDCEKVFDEVVFLDDFDFDIQHTKSKLEEYYDSRTSLFSLESLVGAPFILKGANRSQIPRRLKILGINKIIITLRKQTDIVDSMYRQYIYQGGTVKFADFLNLDKKRSLYARPFNIDYLKYDQLVKEYQTLFGKENVLVVPHESLKKNASQFLNQLSNFICNHDFSIKLEKLQNESLSNLSTNLLRIINHFAFSGMKPNNLVWNGFSTRIIKKIFQVILDPYFFSFFSNKNSYLNPDQSAKLKKYFLNSNKRLTELTDLELKEYINAQ